MSNALCIITPDKEGFLKADVYLKGWRPDIRPDWTCTANIETGRGLLIDKARQDFSGIEVVDTITGFCRECLLEHFSFEKNCRRCGGDVRGR